MGVDAGSRLQQITCVPCQSMFSIKPDRKEPGGKKASKSQHELWSLSPNSRLKNIRVCQVCITSPNWGSKDVRVKRGECWVNYSKTCITTGNSSSIQGFCVGHIFLLYIYTRKCVLLGHPSIRTVSAQPSSTLPPPHHPINLFGWGCKGFLSQM